MCDWILENWPCTHIWPIAFIGPANSHTHTLPVYCCINGLSWLVCFSRAGFADHVKSRLRQWDPWRALDGRHGSDIHPCVSETSVKVLQSCLGLWPALHGLIATPNSPIGGFNPPPASHPPTPPPPGRPSPYTGNLWYYSGCEKSCSKSSSVSYLLQIVIKHHPKDCSSYTANLVWLQSSTREPWQLQYFKSVFLEISIVTFWSVFPNLVTYSLILT